MAFVAIRGRFKPDVGTPDGDSVRFLADEPGLWRRLEGRRARLSTSGPTAGTVQLRFEGIDSIEKAATRALAEASRESMKQLIGYDPQGEREPAGWVLARMTDDQAGRPISWLFAGEAEAPDDGSDIFLDEALVRNSVNYGQMRAGFAYPLYYNTLFAELRETLAEAQADAKAQQRGYWPEDATTSGVTVDGNESLDEIAPIWPKLWRRLEEYLRRNPDLSGFKDWLEEKNERVDIMSRMAEQGLQDVVEVEGDTVRMLVEPEDIRVVASAGFRQR